MKIALVSMLPSLTHFGMGGYWVVFLITLLESLVIAGVVVPGATLVVLAGFLSSQGYLDIGDLIWFAAMGAIFGDGISYYLGTKGIRFFHNENRWLKADHLDRGRRFFHKHGSKSIFFARFITPFRAAVPFVAGLSGMEWGRFLFWNIISAFLWSASHLLAGYLFGDALMAIEAWSTRVGYAVGLIVVFLIVLYAVRFMIIRHGRRVIGFMRSILASVGTAVAGNPDVKRLIGRYPLALAFIRKRISRESFFGLPLTLVVIGFMYVLFLFGGVIEDVLTAQTIVSADVRVANLLAYFRSPELIGIFLWITLLGKWQIVFGTATIASAMLWIGKKKDYIPYLWLALAADEMFNYFGKLAVQRSRPGNPVYIEGSFSFPSGHAMIAMILYGFFAYICMRELKKWGHRVNVFFACMVVVIAIGFSRIYLGVHYMSDVWGGYLLGFLILATVVTVREWRRSKKGGYIMQEHAGISRAGKAGVAGLALVNVLFFVGFALHYHPQFVVPAQAAIRDVDGDIGEYIREHEIPKYSETLLGDPQEPLGFILMAKDDAALMQSFERAGWYAADKVSFGSVARIAEAALLNKQYKHAPMTPSFWNAAINDFGFEKPTEVDTVIQRHHVRIWKTRLRQNGLPVYVGTGSLDAGIKWFITHRISPDIDTERSFIKEDLRAAGEVGDLREIQFVDPVLGKNFSNDEFFTNGKLYIMTVGGR